MTKTNRTLTLITIVASALVFYGCLINPGNPNGQNPYPPA